MGQICDLSKSLKCLYSNKKMLKQLNGKDHNDMKRNGNLCYRDVDACVSYKQEGPRAETMVKSQYAFTVLLKFHSGGAKCFHYKDTTYSVMVAHTHTHTHTHIPAHINESCIYIFTTHQKTTNINFWSTRDTLIYGDSRIHLPRYPRSNNGHTGENVP